MTTEVLEDYVPLFPFLITLEVPWDKEWLHTMPVVAYITEGTIDFDVIHGAN